MGTRALKSGCILVPSKSFLAGAGWVSVSPMLMRGVQPWPSVCIPLLLEAGSYRQKMRSFKGWGADEVRPPLPIFL
jgi:hypothetical protein